jgi:hypothetical protein
MDDHFHQSQNRLPGKKPATKPATSLTASLKRFPMCLVCGDFNVRQISYINSAFGEAAKLREQLNVVGDIDIDAHDAVFCPKCKKKMETLFKGIKRFRKQCVDTACKLNEIYHVNYKPSESRTQSVTSSDCGTQSVMPSDSRNQLVTSSESRIQLMTSSESRTQSVASHLQEASGAAVSQSQVSSVKPRKSMLYLKQTEHELQLLKLPQDVLCEKYAKHAAHLCLPISNQEPNTFRPKPSIEPSDRSMESSGPSMEPSEPSIASNEPSIVPKEPGRIRHSLLASLLPLSYRGPVMNISGPEKLSTETPYK